jgi:hypothetical protein
MAAMEYAAGHCNRCEEPMKVERPGTNHILHLILSVLTFGLWLVIWIGVAVKFGGWRCSKCGTSRVDKVRR